MHREFGKTGQASGWLRYRFFFEDVVFFLLQGDIVDNVKHPNPEKYSGQQIFVLSVDDYVNLVPYVESSEEIFLKTIIPGRKATKEYLGEKK